MWGKDNAGRYVRIELPGREDADARRGGRGLQQRYRPERRLNAAGPRRRTPARAATPIAPLDGNKDGSYGGGGQTPTEEITNNPYWVVDLGRDIPIDSVVIYNRTDGGLGQRLEGFTLSVLDEKRNPVFQKKSLPAPGSAATYEVEGGSTSGESEDVIRHLRR